MTGSKERVIKRAKTIKEQNRLLDEYLQQFGPKVVEERIENGYKIRVYEAR